MAIDDASGLITADILDRVHSWHTSPADRLSAQDELFSVVAKGVYTIAQHPDDYHLHLKDEFNELLAERIRVEGRNSGNKFWHKNMDDLFALENCIDPRIQETIGLRMVTRR